VRDEGVGILVILLLLGAGWWFFDNYEILEKSDSNEELSSELGGIIAEPVKPLRPTGLTSISSTEQGTELSVDSDTVRGPRSARLGWVISDHSKDSTVSARTTKELQLVDCDIGGLKVLSLVQYNAEGQVIWQQDFEKEAVATSYYPPGTVGASFQREVCDSRYDESAP
jgi:Surface-adhesin protein E